MAEVTPGVYTIRELLDRAGFNAEEEAAADYNDSGYDFRRVQVGGLPFGDLDDRIRIPEGANSVEISLDAAVAAVLEVK